MLRRFFTSYRVLNNSSTPSVITAAGFLFQLNKHDYHSTNAENNRSHNHKHQHRNNNYHQRKRREFRITKQDAIEHQHHHQRSSSSSLVPSRISRFNNDSNHLQNKKTSARRPWVLVELRDGQYFRFEIPLNLVEFYSPSTSPSSPSSPSSPAMPIPLNLGDLVLTRVGDLFQTGIVHCSAATGFTTFLPYTFHLEPEVNLVQKDGGNMMTISATVFPRTGGEIIGILRKSDLIDVPSMMRDNNVLDMISEMQSPSSSSSSPVYAWSSSRNHRHSSSSPQSSFRETRQQYKLVTLARTTTDEELVQRFSNLAPFLAHRENHSSVYNILAQQTEIEQQFLEAARDALVAKNIRTLNILSCATDVTRKAVTFFYSETDVGTPLTDFKEYLTQVVFQNQVKGVWMVNVAAENIFDELQLVVHRGAGTAMSKSSRLQAAKRAMLKSMKGAARLQQQGDNQHHHQDDEKLEMTRTLLEGIKAQDAARWPTQIAWPSVSRHYVNQGDSVFSASRTALQHLLRCIFAKPEDFKLFDESFSVSSNGVWKTATTMMSKVLKKSTSSSSSSLLALSTCLIICSLCGKLDEELLRSLQVQNTAIKLSPRDALSMFIFLKNNSNTSPSSSSHHRQRALDYFLSQICPSASSSNKNSNNNILLLTLDFNEFCNFYDELITEVANEYTSISPPSNNNDKLLLSSSDETSSSLTTSNDYKKMQLIEEILARPLEKDIQRHGLLFAEHLLVSSNNNTNNNNNLLSDPRSRYAVALHRIKMQQISWALRDKKEIDRLKREQQQERAKLIHRQQEKLIWEQAQLNSSSSSSPQGESSSSSQMLVAVSSPSSSSALIPQEQQEQELALLDKRHVQEIEATQRFHAQRLAQESGLVAVALGNAARFPFVTRYKPGGNMYNGCGVIVGRDGAERMISCTSSSTSPNDSTNNNENNTVLASFGAKQNNTEDNSSVAAAEDEYLSAIKSEIENAQSEKSLSSQDNNQLLQNVEDFLHSENSSSSSRNNYNTKFDDDDDMLSKIFARRSDKTHHLQASLDGIQTAMLIRNCEELSSIKRTVFETGLELLARKATSASLQDNENNKNEFNPIFTPSWVKQIRKIYIANYHQELPLRSLKHWAMLMRLSMMKTTTRTSNNTSEKDSSSSSSSQWKHAIQVLVKNFRVTLHHSNNNKNKNQIDDHRVADEQVISNFSSQDRIQLLEQADKILQVVTINNEFDTPSQQEKVNDQKVQKMRAVLKGMMNAMKSTEEKNISNEKQQQQENAVSSEARLAWNKKLASVALLFESAELK